MKSMDYREIKDLLSSKGFSVISCKGSHEKWKNCITNQTIIVPKGREIAPGTVRDILKLLRNIPIISGQKVG